MKGCKRKDASVLEGQFVFMCASGGKATIILLYTRGNRARWGINHQLREMFFYLQARWPLFQNISFL
jgi:hypothetical protein